MPIRRSRSKISNMYLPSNSRYNQFLLAEFKITDQLLAHFSDAESVDKIQPFQRFYQKISEQLFGICEQQEIDNVHFIANDKLPRVRVNKEIRQWQTEQQMLIFYNPELHQFYKSHYDGALRAQKISILFLASGDSIRTNSANYHSKVRNVITALTEQVGIPAEAVRVRDHQHLTYDLYAKDKGVVGTHSHSLRLIENRYKAADFNLPKQHDTISYVVASFPVSRRLLKRADVNLVGEKDYQNFYNMLNSACLSAAEHYKLKNGAFIANGLTPIVRNSSTEPQQVIGELQMLGFDPKQPNNEFYSNWRNDHLVDYIQIIYAATIADIEDKGFSQFLTRVDKSLKMMAKELELLPEKDEIVLRFHQHLAYHFDQA